MWLNIDFALFFILQNQFWNDSRPVGAAAESAGQCAAAVLCDHHKDSEC